MPMVDPQLITGWEVEGFDYAGFRPRPGEMLTTEYSCILTEGDRVRDCQIDFQRPENEPGSRRFLASADRVRVSYDPGQAVQNGQIFYWASGMTTVIDYIATIPAR